MVETSTTPTAPKQTPPATCTAAVGARTVTELLVVRTAEEAAPSGLPTRHVAARAAEVVVAVGESDMVRHHRWTQPSLSSDTRLGFQPATQPILMNNTYLAGFTICPELMKILNPPLPATMAVSWTTSSQAESERGRASSRPGQEYSTCSN
jgi:hypothetical protein